MSTFSKAIDTDLYILEELEGTDLDHLCNIDKYFKNLCTSEFWKKRTLSFIRNKYNWYIPPSKNANLTILDSMKNPPEGTWNQFYLRIYNAYQILQNGNIELADHIIRLIFKYPTKQYFNEFNGDYMLVIYIENPMDDKSIENTKNKLYKYFPSPYFIVNFHEQRKTFFIRKSKKFI